MDRVRAVTCVLVIAAALPSTGCSVLFVRPPKPSYRITREVHCTSANVAPALDIVLAGASAIRSAVAIASPDTSFSLPQTTRPVTIVGGLALTGLFALSASVGFDRTERCRDAIEELSHPPSLQPPAPAAPRPSP